MPGKEKKISKKESTNSELQQSLMEIKTQMDKFNEMLLAMQEKVGSSLQKQIDSIVSHLVVLKREFLVLQEKVEKIETQDRATSVAYEELKQQRQQQHQWQQQKQHDTESARAKQTHHRVCKRWKPKTEICK